MPKPSTLTCPECGGALWELADDKPLRYRCHTGHANSPLSLESAQAEALGQSLAAGLRGLRERELLLLRLATVADASGDRKQAEAGRKEATRVRQQALELQQMIKAPPAQRPAPTPAGAH